MIKSKFIALYQSLNKSEHKLLLKWVDSPIHNQHLIVQKLFIYLSKRSKINKTTVAKNRIFKHLFPQQKYNDAQLRHIQSYALEVLENFVGYNQALSNQLTFKKNQLEVYQARKLQKLSQQTLKKIDKQLAQSSLENGAHHLMAYEVEIERFKLGSIEHRTQNNNLPQLFNHLSQFYIISTLKYACTAASHRNVYNINYNIPLLDAVLEYAKNATNSYVIKIYYYAYLALNQPKEEKHYQSLKDYFFEHSQLLNKEEQYEVFQLTINYCIKQLNMGNTIYFEEVFELYKKGLESKILFIQGTLSRFTYKNIVSAGLKLGQFDWVKSFIKDYTTFLPTVFQNNYQHYNTAKLMFVQNYYDQALKLLLQVEDYDDLFLTLDAKMMLLKIYYEEDSFDALNALIISFKTFLQRKDVMGYHKQVYQNILRLMNKLLGIPLQDQVAKEELKKEIETTQPLVERQWLLDQLQQIK
ncbi:MAG: hypothetical protein GY810_29150 [Aureispira sp.]|nr:hypothetical protein [Aureispira sp.]